MSVQEFKIVQFKDQRAHQSVVGNSTEQLLLEFYERGTLRKMDVKLANETKRMDESKILLTAKHQVQHIAKSHPSTTINTKHDFHKFQNGYYFFLSQCVCLPIDVSVERKTVLMLFPAVADISCCCCCWCCREMKYFIWIRSEFSMTNFV